MKIHGFAAVLVVCATGCPVDGGGTGPGTTGTTGTTGGADGPTEGALPTTSASQGEPTGTTGTTAGPGTDTAPGETVTATTDTDTGVVDATDTTGVVHTTDTTDDAETATTATTGESETDTRGTDGETGSDEDPPPGSLACRALEFEEPIIIDDFSQNPWTLRELPALAVAWRGDMVIARSQRRIDGTPGCEVWWDRRDDAGQKIGDTVVIPVPATATDDTDACEMIGDIVWDAAHQRYIFLHPLEDAVAPGLRSLPLAIAPDGELVWTASGETRRGMYQAGVVSQMRIVGDELFVLGQNYPENGLSSSRPAAHVYSTADGALLRTITPPLQTIADGTIACDATCEKGVFIGEKSGFQLWQIDMKTGAMIDEPTSLGYPALMGTPMLDWRGDTLFTARNRFEDVDEVWFETGFLKINASWDQKAQTLMPTAGFHMWHSWYEPSWVRTDDGYIVVSTRHPWINSFSTGDYREMRVQVWNLEFDGSIRETTLLPDLRSHTPRIAIKEGRVAITYVHMFDKYQALHSKRMVFASCPP